MRIAFFGLPIAALLMLEDGHEIGFAALSRADAVGRRRLTTRLGPERVRLRSQLGASEIEQRLTQLRPDLIVSWFWTTKLPLHIVELSGLGAIGAHPSLLPRHRGPDPYFAAIDQGDETTGVTIHRIDAEYDTGAILAQRSLRIDPAWNAWQLARKLDRPSLSMLRDVVAQFARGERIEELAQDEAHATWAPEPGDEACAIRWTLSTEQVLRRIRALCPVPGAFTEINGEIVTILRAERARSYPRALAPGEAAVVNEAAVVRTADDAVTLVAGECGQDRLGRADLATLVARARDKMIG